MEGSKSLSVPITLSNILDKVKSSSYYQGESRKEDPNLLGLGAKMQISDDEDVILKDYINKGISRLNNLLTKIIGETTNSWDTGNAIVTFTVKTVSNFMESQLASLIELAQDYLVDSTLNDWLAVIKPDETKIFSEKIAEYSNEFRVLASHRSKPTRS